MRRIVFGLLLFLFALNGEAASPFTNAIVGTANAGAGDTLKTAADKWNYADNWIYTNLVTVSNLALIGGSGGAKLTISSNLSDLASAETARVNLGFYIPENPIAYGADPTGVSDSTTSFESARDAARSNGRGVVVSPGTYKVNIALDGRDSFLGQSIKYTVLKPQNAALPVVIFNGPTISTNREWAVVGNFTIDGGGAASTIGLKIGTNGAGLTGAARTRFRDIRITNTRTANMWIDDATTCIFENIYTDDCTTGYGLYVDNERNFQDCLFINLINRTCEVGAYWGSGNRITVIGGNTESNDSTGWIVKRGDSSGPAHFTVAGHWFENNGRFASATLAKTNASLYFFASGTTADTNSLDWVMQRCNITSAANAFDIWSDAAQGLLIDGGSFTSLSSNGFLTNKVQYDRTLADRTFITVRNVGELNVLPNPTLYANWPTLTATSNGGESGFFYDFDWMGRKYSNRKAGLNGLWSVDTTGAANFNTATVNAVAYNATTWNGSTNVPTMDAIRDKIETMGGGFASTDIDTLAELNAIVGDADLTPQSRSLTAGVGISGGGDLSGDRTFTLDLSELTANQTVFDSANASRTITFGLSGATDPVLTLANNSVSWNTPATFGSGNGQIDIGSTGVRITSDGDGAMTWLGLGDGSDEDLTWNLDDTANTVVVSSSTGVTKIDFGSIAVVSAATNYFEFCISDETTAITTGTAKVTWRAPFAFTVKDLRASLSTVSSSGIPTVDINEGGTTIIGTKLTIDANEKTSTTAAAAYALSDSAIADDAEITFDIDVAGTGAAGLKVKIYYTRP